MFRVIRNFLVGITVAAAAATAVRVVLTMLSPEQREKLNAHIKQAVESGKEAAAEKRAELEDRLNELVTENSNHRG